MEGSEFTPPRELSPFIHQVGGHSFMLTQNDGTVCKALLSRELEFYKSLPTSLRKYVPAFQGIINVCTIVDAEGIVKFLTNSLPKYAPQSPTAGQVIFKKSGSIEILGGNDAFTEEESTAEGAVLRLNPWALKCYRDYIINASLKESSPQEFILLDDLTWKFTYPCILDLKMGTRQYGDTASLAKKQSKMVKVVSTTSAKLGMRVGGMQVFQKQYRRFMCRNKFYGRQLTVNGFQQSLVNFLHNGIRFRSDVLPILIRKLEELAEVLGQLEAIRLYTTSLLLIYEGEDHCCTSDDVCPVNFKLDRKNSFKNCDSELGRKTCSVESLSAYEDDAGGECHRKRRASSVTNLDSCSLSGASSNSSSNSTIFEEVCDSWKTGRQPEGFRGRSLSTRSEPGGSKGLEPIVDVKMVDFAHSTHKDDAVVYKGPDKGFLFGLEKLINMLKVLETDYG